MQDTGKSTHVSSISYIEHKTKAYVQDITATLAAAQEPSWQQSNNGGFYGLYT
ncbi:hypothetical protein DPMN_129969 [Dreissena polymorpha]|uniref:Uncharacterized protein n=1 Tax=Dreissena polymorpha TaxID=45954 RepID=A0A9D4JX59_DREPO|nr:hypothetical protein DPMN_129969 [Dreissena polymorpha]